MDLPFIADIAGLVQQITEPSSSGWNRIGKSLASMAVPAPIRDVRNTMDKTVRAPSTPLEVIENSIPGLSQRVAPKTTILGDVKKLADTFPWGWTKQISVPAKTDPESNELHSLNWSPPMPVARFTMKDRTTGKDSIKNLDGAEKQAYLNDMGLATRAAIKRALDEHAYQRETPAQRIDTLTMLIHDAQKQVHAQYKGYLGIVDNPGNPDDNVYSPENEAAAKPRFDARLKAGVITKEAANGVIK
jgi:hypothetical protein